MSYQGWKNYETWAVSLWLDNEEGSYHYLRELADSAAVGNDREDATVELAQAVKSWLEESAPEVEGLWGDLLSAALSEVDWYEVAASALEDCEFEDEQEVA